MIHSYWKLFYLSKSEAFLINQLQQTEV